MLKKEQELRRDVNEFLCRGQGMATAEQSLCYLAYNFRRVYNIFKANGVKMVDVMA